MEWRRTENEGVVSIRTVLHSLEVVGLGAYFRELIGWNGTGTNPTGQLHSWAMLCRLTYFGLRCGSRDQGLVRCGKPRYMRDALVHTICKRTNDSISISMLVIAGGRSRPLWHPGAKAGRYASSRSCVPCHRDDEPLFGGLGGQKLMASESVGASANFSIRRLVRMRVWAVRLSHFGWPNPQWGP